MLYEGGRCRRDRDPSRSLTWIDHFKSGHSEYKPIHLAFSCKGKPGEDVGQPGIRAGDTRVSHTSPKGECGTPWYHQ